MKTHNRDGKFAKGHPPMGGRPRSLAKVVRLELKGLDLAAEVRRLRETDPAGFLSLALQVGGPQNAN